MLISRKSSNLNITTLVAILVIGLSSCYENMEGCLDPDSSNYDVTADIACEDCCTYPQLSIFVNHKYDEAGFSRTQIITNDIGERFVILDVQTYLSGITLINGDDQFTVEEIIEYESIDGNTESIPDDIILVTPNKVKYDIGTFTHANTYNSLNLQLGVPSVIDNALSITVDQGHPLAIAGDSLYLNDQNKYVESYIVIRQIDVHKTPDTLQIIAPSWSFASHDLAIEQLRGSSVSLSFDMDYLSLISTIDYNTMTKDEIKTKIGSNFPLALKPNF